MTHATKPTGHDVPNTTFFLSNAHKALAITGMTLLTLSGCSLTKKADAPEAQVTRPASAKDRVAGKTADAGGRYVDPMIAKAGLQRTKTQAPQSLTEEQAALLATPPASPAPDGAFPPAPAAPQQVSIAGLATQPTGVRANAGTIFSSTQPVPVVTSSSNGPVPADLPRRGFNATMGSVFSAPQPVQATAAAAPMPPAVQ